MPSLPPYDMLRTLALSYYSGDFLDRLKASEGDDTVVNSVGDILEQQVRKNKN